MDRLGRLRQRLGNLERRRRASLEIDYDFLGTRNWSLDDEGWEEIDRRGGPIVGSENIILQRERSTGRLRAFWLAPTQGDMRFL